jgi:glycerate 2-kinase
VPTTPRPLRIVIAPDSFKGSASAWQVARGIALGWSGERPDDDVQLVPMADGGEGTLESVEHAVPAARREVIVVDGPAGRAISTYWLRLPDGTGVVELASTSGLTRLERPDPLGAGTLGFGQAIAAALDAGVSSLLLAIGGSASTDAGVGALSALGGRFLDAEGRPIASGNAGLGHLAAVDLSGLRALPPGGVRVLTDVTNPLVGPDGAAAVFGPQKGATPDDVALLDAALRRWADVLARDLGVHVADFPGAGGAGGTAAGAVAVLGARVTSGAALVCDLVGLDDALAGAALCVTGEGSLDGQTLGGKAPAEVARRARTAGVPCVGLAGAVALTAAERAAAGLAGAHALSEVEPDLGRCRAEAAAVLAGLAAAVLPRYLP